ncbi:MAG: GntR family transcriptional regulator [Clostridiales bacterium]|nr:GntR family transcriptional regulator [Clostridiales bacterium]
MQIVDRIKRMCELGLYGEDGKLPSCRDLAMSMGVNPNTVQRAYNQLEEEGYVTSSPKKGYFVNAVDSRRESAAMDKIKELKAAGLTRAELLCIVNTVYGGDDD